MQMIKMKKVIISAILATLFVLTSSICAFAQTVSLKDLNSLKLEIAKNMKERNTVFTLNYTGDTQELLQKANNVIKEAYESDDYLRWSWKSYNTKISGYYGNVNITFNFVYWTTKEQEVFIENKATEIVNQLIKPGMSDYEKVKVLNEYVINLVDYDWSLQKNTAYNALVDKKAVCQGYALLLDKLLEKAGIPSIIIGGNLSGTPHAWNIVKIDGNWYHVDATNNDTNNNKFFLVSDEFMIQNRFVWDRNYYPSATSNYVYINKNEEVKNQVTNTVDEENLIKSAKAKLDYAKLYVSNYTLKNAVNEIMKISDKTIKNQLMAEAYNIVDREIQKVAVKKLDSDIKNAELLIEVLPNEYKGDLVEKLNEVIEAKNISIITNYVNYYLNDRFSTSKLTNALKKVDELQNQTLKEELMNKIYSSVNYVVSMAERYRNSYISKAYNIVNLLPEGSEKLEFLQRLNAIK